MLISGARFAVGADSDLAAWIALWDAPPPAGERQRLEALFAGIKADGCWDGLDVLHLGPPNVYGSQYNARKPRSDRQLGIQRGSFNDVRYIDGKGWFLMYGYSPNGEDYNESLLLFDQFLPDQMAYSPTLAAAGGFVLRDAGATGMSEYASAQGESRLIEASGRENGTSITLSTNSSASELSAGAFGVNGLGQYLRSTKPSSRLGGYSASREGNNLRLRHVQTNGNVYTQNQITNDQALKRPSSAANLADIVGAWWCGGLTHDQAAAVTDRIRTYMVAKGLA